MAQHFTPQLTADGSYTFFSERFGEAFHSTYGASREANKIYVQGCQLMEKAQTNSTLSLLDICYGLGYNTAAALEIIWQANPSCKVELVGLELDIEVPQTTIKHSLLQQWKSPIPDLLAELTQTQIVQTPQLTAKLLIGDARTTIQSVQQSGFQAEAIFLDPFSPPKCPQLWTVEFLNLVGKCLTPTGILATYSNAAAVRNSLQLAGLNIASLYATEGKKPGTIASHGFDLPCLSQKEREQLQTKSAIPYRDRDLQDTANNIKQRREVEQAASSLESTTQWKKRWLS